MRSKGSRFTLGVWGLRVCSLDVAFASATVRNRPQPSARGPYGRAYGKFCRGGNFWRFQTCRCFVSRGRRGTSWHSDMFCNVLKIVLRGRRNTFATFSEDVLQFSWQAQHFGRVHRHFSWQAQHFRRVALIRVACFLQIALAGLRQVATRCKFRGRRGILCDVLKIDGSLARNIDFDVANFRVLRKTRRKTSILKLQSVKIWGSLARNACFGAPTCLFSRVWFSRGLAVSMGEAAKLVLLSCCQLWKLPEVSHKMLVFLYPRVLSRGACFSVASPCLWGKLENMSFSNVSKQVVMLFCVADVALFDIPTCLMMFTKLQNWRKSRTKCCFSRMRSKGSRFTLGVWGLRVCSLDVAFTVATVRNRPREDHMAVPMGSSAEVVIFGGFRRVVASFRVAGVALRDIQTQRVENRFAWQTQYFCDVFRRCVAVFVPGAALWTCPSSFFVAGAAL